MTFKRAGLRYGETPEPVTPYQKAAQVWDERIGSARVQAHNWRLMALGSLVLSLDPGGDPAVDRPLRLRHAVRRRGRPTGWGARGGTRGGELQAERRADRLPPRALRRQRALAVDRSRRRAPELAQGLRLRHRPGGGDPQRVRPRQRSLRQGRPRDRRRRDHQRRARVGELRSRCAGWSGASRAAPLKDTKRLTGLFSIVITPPRTVELRAQEPARHLRARVQLVAGRQPPESRNEHAPQHRRPRRCWLWRSAPAPPESRCRRSRSSTAPRSRRPSASRSRNRRFEYVEVPKPLPLPGQLKPLPKAAEKQKDERSPKERIAGANAAARIDPVEDGYINAIQVYPYTKGALYQLYAAVNQVTDIALEPGEKLVVGLGRRHRALGGRRHHAAARARTPASTSWSSRSAPTSRPTCVITTDRRTYHLEMRSSQATYMASVSWTYPASELISLRKQRAEAEAAATAVADTGVNIEQLRFRYRIEGDAPWKPRQVFDDGAKVYIQFPSGLAQSEAPPLFVIGAGRQAGARQLPRARHHLHRRSAVRRRRTAARHRAAARRAHRAHRCRLAGDAAMTTPDPNDPAKSRCQGGARDARAARQAAASHAHQPQGADRRRGGAAVPDLRHRAGGPQAAEPAHRQPARSCSMSTTSRSPTGCPSCPPPMKVWADKKRCRKAQQPSRPGAPADGAATGARSPRPSVSRKRDSPAWPARPAKLQCSSACS